MLLINCYVVCKAVRITVAAGFWYLSNKIFQLFIKYATFINIRPFRDPPEQQEEEATIIGQNTKVIPTKATKRMILLILFLPMGVLLVTDNWTSKQKPQEHERHERRR